jgi:hypothetical protein
MMMRCWWHFGRVVDWLATNTFTSRKRRNKVVQQQERRGVKKRQNGDGGFMKEILGEPDVIILFDGQ